MLAAGALQQGDLVGFTFFIGTMAMGAASVFFFFERATVSDKWKLSLLNSALITTIAAAHYWYMREFWVSTFNGTNAAVASPTEFRYIDWLLTVPLMCVEFFLLLRTAGASINMLWRLIGYSLLMLIAGYIGEVSAESGKPIRGFENFGWGVISTIGWAGIVYEIFFGEAKQLADGSSDVSVRHAFNLLRGFVLIGWAIYPIGYMTLPGNVLSGSTELAANMNVVYNIGDAINKVGFGLVVWNLAKRGK
jgi:bacteriorhodopsin